jgi:hypothetical protein
VKFVVETGAALAGRVFVLERGKAGSSLRSE